MHLKRNAEITSTTSNSGEESRYNQSNHLVTYESSTVLTIIWSPTSMNGGACAIWWIYKQDKNKISDAYSSLKLVNELELQTD